MGALSGRYVVLQFWIFSAPSGPYFFKLFFLKDVKTENVKDDTYVVSFSGFSCMRCPSTSTVVLQ